jgi:hypothetical protein
MTFPLEKLYRDSETFHFYPNHHHHHRHAKQPFQRIPTLLGLSPLGFLHAKKSQQANTREKNLSQSHILFCLLIVCDQLQGVLVEEKKRNLEMIKQNNDNSLTD